MIRAAIQLTRGSFTLDVDFTTDTHATGAFGPSGAGKTTLINAIAGLQRPDRGSVVLDGHTLFDSARGIDVPAHRRHIGVVFQEHRLFPHLSVKGNLQYGRPRKSELGDRGFKRIVDLLELAPLLARRVTEISGGERQRVALGRALVSEPRLLLLDEPLSSLDQRLKQQIIPYLQRVRDVSATPMLYVSHDLTELLQLTDRLLILEHGSLAGQGRYADLVHDDSVLNVIHDRGMRNVLTARVVRHEPSEGVSVLQIGPENNPLRQLIVPRCSADAGAGVTISIQPWDVALATTPVHPVSIQNQICGKVTRCTMHDRRAIVEVDIGAPLIVEISRRSAASLKIDAGQSIICLVKSNAIRQIGTGVNDERSETERPVPN